VIFAERGIRPLPRLPLSRENEPGQGDRQNYEIPEGPRSNNEKDSIGGWRPKGFINIALDQGFRLGFQDRLEPVARVSPF
jgi:hypothetical protein